MIARLLRSDDFERVLRSRSRASSTHFAVHHLADRPGSGRPAAPAAASSAVHLDKPSNSQELSTGVASNAIPSVDDSRPDRLWLGAVVPKRHAKRAVTRTLLKRQIRSAVSGNEAALAAGLWVVRLRAPFDRSQFVSAASDALKAAAQSELRQLLVSAAQRVAAR